jgi:hypothetical protein
VAAEDEGPARRLEHFKIDPVNRAIPNVDIGELVTDAQLLLSIEQGSTVTLNVFDKDLKLLRGDFLTGWTWGKNADDVDEDHWIREGRDIDGTIDGHRFRLVNVTKTGRTVEMVFEDLVSVLLKSHRGHAAGGQGERGGGGHPRRVRQAALRRRRREAVRAGAPPDAADPEGVPETHRGRTARRRETRPRLERRAGAQPGAAQARRAVHGRRRQPQRRPAPDAGDDRRRVRGVRLGRKPRPRGTTFQTTVIPEQQLEKQAYHFLKGGDSFLAGGAIGLVKAHPQMSVGEVASRVEISDKGASHYSPFTDRALKIYAAYHGSTGDGTALSTSFNVTQPYVFERGRTETSAGTASSDSRKRSAGPRSPALAASGSSARTTCSPRSRRSPPS